jgi:hypothetical protein
VWWKTKSEVKKEDWRGVTRVVRKKKSEREKEKEKEKEGGVVWCVMLG